MSRTENPILRHVERFFSTLDHQIEKPVRAHLKNVYGALCMCVAAAAAGAYVHVATEALKGGLLASLGSLGLLLALYSQPPNGRNDGLRMGLFLGFGALSGLATGPLLDFALALNPGIIVTAFLGATLVFGAFTLAALFAPSRKYLYLGGVLLSALSTLFWISLANVFFQSSAVMSLQLYGGLVITSLFILYDTQLIIEKRRQGDTDFVWHAVDLFIDFLDLFRRLLVILAQKEDRKKRRD